MKLTESQLRKFIASETKKMLQETKRFSLKTLLREEEAQEVKGVSWDSNYEAFVSALKSNASDPKVQAFIKAGKLDKDENDDKFSFNSSNLPVAGLTPTQNEIDVDKSLGWPLKKAESFLNFVKGAGQTFTLGSPIVTYKGKYIIDGHHRWSQLYACNKDASIAAVDISVEGLDPLDVLKAVQAAIAIETGDVPVQSVEGTNLLKIDESGLQAWLKSKMSPAFLEACKADEGALSIMKKAGSEGGEVGELVGAFIWTNVQDMQAQSQPVPGAPKRDFMPQTDNIDWQKPLAAGEVDIAAPHAATKAESVLRKNGETVLVERWQKLAGLIK